MCLRVRGSIYSTRQYASISLYSVYKETRECISPWYEPPLVPRIPEHGVGLAAARLTVGEAARVEPVQNMVHLHRGTGTRNKGRKGQVRASLPTAVGG